MHCIQVASVQCFLLHTDAISCPHDVCNTHVNVPKVSGLQASRSSLIDAEEALEVAVQGVEEAITKAPEEEENGDETDWVDGLAEGELCGARALVVFGL